MDVRHVHGVHQPVADAAAVRLCINGIVRAVVIIGHIAGALCVRGKHHGVIRAGIHDDRVGNDAERQHGKHLPQSAK